MENSKASLKTVARERYAGASYFAAVKFFTTSRRNAPSYNGTTSRLCASSNFTPCRNSRCVPFCKVMPRERRYFGFRKSLGTWVPHVFGTYSSAENFSIACHFLSLRVRLRPVRQPAPQAGIISNKLSYSRLLSAPNKSAGIDANAS